MSYGATPSTTGSRVLPAVDTLKGKTRQFVSDVAEASSQLCTMHDWPVLGMPWFLFALALVPAALLEDPLLGYLSLCDCLLISFGFFLFSRGRAWLTIAIACLAFTLLGEFAGRYDRYKYTSELAIYQLSPSYDDVLPTADPGAFKDGASLEFSARTRVDTTRGLGYINGKQWCVAPIVNGPMDTIGFWAVGTDCCRARGLFACGDVTNTSVRSGLVVLDGSHFSSPDIANYMTAARMASETYALNLPEDPIFVQWDVSLGQVLAENLRNASLLVIYALFACLVVVPCFVILLTLTDLSLTKSESSTVQDMTFGFEWFPQDYDQQLQRDLLNHRCYWSGEVIYDYAFHLANKNLFLGPLLCHPAHPFSRWERTLVLATVCLLIVFPVSVSMVVFGETSMIRTIICLVGATIPRNLLKIYLIDVSQADAELELEGGDDMRSREKIRRAQSYEFIFLTVIIVVTVIICAVSAAYIKAHTDRPLGKVLLRNTDGLGYAFVLDVLFDLLMPYFGKAEYEHQITMGFFGRWRWERDDFTIGKALQGEPDARKRQLQQRATPMEALASAPQGGAGALLAQRQPPAR